MELEDRRYSALIVSCYPRFTAALQDILPGEDFYPPETAESVAAARRRLSEQDYDAVIVRVPLRDENGIGFALELARKRSCAAVVFTANDSFTEISSRVQSGGVFAVPLMASRQVVVYSVGWLKAVRERLRIMDEKTLTLEERMKQIRLVNRAKLLLMSGRGMTEDEAHRHIGRLAMDSGRTRAAVAEEVIAAFEGSGAAAGNG